MVESADTRAPQSPAAPLPAAAVPRFRPVRRLLRLAAAPVRFVRRRPRRAAGLLAAAVLLAVAGVAGYFQYHLRAARRELDRGHNAAAKRHLDACRRVYPEHGQVLLLSARAARRGGAWEEAEAYLDRYWQRNGDDDRLVFERLLLKGTRGDAEAVPPLLARVEQGGPDANPAREALVAGLLSRFRWGPARQALDAWLAEQPDNTTALLLRAKLLDQGNASGEAIQTYRRALELDPELDDARLGLTTDLLNLRQAEEALPHLAYLRGRLPDHAYVHVQWVRALAAQGRTAEARAALDDCLRKHPDEPSALGERAKYAVDDGDDPAAEGYLARAIQSDPGNVSMRRLYAAVLARNGKADESARQLAKAKELEADNERFRDLIRGPLQANPDDPSVYHDIGMIALKMGLIAEAVRWFQDALRVGPDYLPTHRVLAAYYQEVGNPILAAKHRALAHRLGGAKSP